MLHTFRRICRAIGCADSVYGDSLVVISVRGGVVVGATDVGVAELEEWSCGDISAYIF